MNRWIKMKKFGSGDGEVEKLAMDNCLDILSDMAKRTGGLVPKSGRFFKCKTCHRKFPTFQALGGHSASHSRPRLISGDELNNEQRSSTKVKIHTCSHCKTEFWTGQALGGHMRRHRREREVKIDCSSRIVVDDSEVVDPVVKKVENCSSRIVVEDSEVVDPVVKKVESCISSDELGADFDKFVPEEDSISSKKLFPWDLNLTPDDEDVENVVC